MRADDKIAQIMMTAEHEDARKAHADDIKQQHADDMKSNVF